MAGGGRKKSRSTGVRAAAVAVCAVVAAIVCGGPAWAQPPSDTSTEPLPPPSVAQVFALTLSPPSGPPGTMFNAIATSHCVDLRFDAGNAERIGTSLNTATFVAPTDRDTTTVDVSVQCAGGELVYRTFIIEHPPAELDLVFSPDQGSPGNRATATLQGCADDEFVLRWGNSTIEVPAGGEFIVPAGEPGTRTVTATCGSTGDDAAEFTVLDAVAPTLTLDAPQGEPGSTFRAVGKDFVCGSGDVEVRWDGAYPTATNSGSFEVTLTVPADAQARRYTVRAACLDEPDIAAEEPFTVAETVVPRPPPAANVALDPSGGAPGDEVSVTGTQFLCDNDSRQIQLTFGAHMLPDVSADATGAFRTTFTVPQDAAGTVTLRAACDDSSIVQTASFTVEGPVIPTATTVAEEAEQQQSDDGLAVLVILLVLTAAVIVVVMVYRGLRKPRPPAPNARVRLKQRAGDPSDVVLREKAGHGSHAIRLSVTAGAATHTIERGER